MQRKLNISCLTTEFNGIIWKLCLIDQGALRCTEVRLHMHLLPYHLQCPLESRSGVLHLITSTSTTMVVFFPANTGIKYIVENTKQFISMLKSTILYQKSTIILVSTTLRTPGPKPLYVVYIHKHPLAM
jgi:hypothetical protein